MMDILGAVKVKDGLFVGDELSAHDFEFLLANKVSHVVNCAGRQVPNNYENIGIQYLTYFWMDHDNQLILDNRDQVANEVAAFIQESVDEGESVLIHSFRGQSRSCCIVVAYLMKRYQWSLEKTIEYLTSRRGDIQIKRGFMKQLEDYEKRLFGPNLNKKRSVDWNDGPVADLDSEELLLRNTYINSRNDNLASTQPSSPSAPGPGEPSNGTRRLAWADRGADDKERLETTNLSSSAAPLSTDPPSFSTVNGTKATLKSILKNRVASASTPSPSVASATFVPASASSSTALAASSSTGKTVAPADDGQRAGDKLCGTLLDSGPSKDTSQHTTAFVPSLRASSVGEQFFSSQAHTSASSNGVVSSSAFFQQLPQPKAPQGGQTCTQAPNGVVAGALNAGREVAMGTEQSSGAQRQGTGKEMSGAAASNLNAGVSGAAVGPESGSLTKNAGASAHDIAPAAPASLYTTKDARCSRKDSSDVCDSTSGVKTSSGPYSAGDSCRGLQLKMLKRHQYIPPAEARADIDTPTSVVDDGQPSPTDTAQSNRDYRTSQNSNGTGLTQANNKDEASHAPSRFTQAVQRREVFPWATGEDEDGHGEHRSTSENARSILRRGLYRDVFDQDAAFRNTASVRELKNGSHSGAALGSFFLGSSLSLNAPHNLGAADGFLPMHTTNGRQARALDTRSARPSTPPLMLRQGSPTSANGASVAGGVGGSLNNTYNRDRMAEGGSLHLTGAYGAYRERGSSRRDSGVTPPNRVREPSPMLGASQRERGSSASLRKGSPGPLRLGGSNASASRAFAGYEKSRVMTNGFGNGTLYGNLNRDDGQSQRSGGFRPRGDGSARVGSSEDECQEQYGSNAMRKKRPSTAPSSRPYLTHGRPPSPGPLRGTLNGRPPSPHHSRPASPAVGVSVPAPTTTLLSMSGGSGLLLDKFAGGHSITAGGRSGRTLSGHLKRYEFMYIRLHPMGAVSHPHAPQQDPRRR
ncbi:unnamed protein product [Vitrella brassicaformis CCMP3155]|uniref:Tyrosine-protein phosphatase domain-containing protein n=2 Tax=Vitrella brassicaformis TaxID=1169539 RepID=A0A0G4FF43_VITBC|nr:unnamed protein product [Vitrella brassicaformis CCMP3155]|eukprot:CEM11682.1 unnamed protein product [Vitrella brassicaformis CCMP3155]